jgi:hypothetical protein
VRVLLSEVLALEILLHHVHVEIDLLLRHPRRHIIFSGCSIGLPRFALVFWGESPSIMC